MTDFEGPKKPRLHRGPSLRRRHGCCLLLFMLAFPVSSRASTSSRAKTLTPDRIQTYADRARRFENAGLYRLAAAQWDWLSEAVTPGNRFKEAGKSARAAFMKTQFDEALIFEKQNAWPLAASRCREVLEMGPRHDGCRKLVHRVERRSEQVAGLQELVADDFGAGVAAFDAGDWDRALENFIKVMNIDPQNIGARRYIEQIGDRKGWTE